MFNIKNTVRSVGMAWSHMHCLLHTFYFFKKQTKSSSYLKFVVRDSAKVSTFCALQLHDCVPTIGYGDAIYRTNQYFITEQNSFPHTGAFNIKIFFTSQITNNLGNSYVSDRYAFSFAIVSITS